MSATRTDTRGGLWVRETAPIILLLVLITAVGVFLRKSGLEWLVGAGPTPSFSFHPDDRRFVAMVSDFERGSVDGYVLGMGTQLFLLNALLSRIGAHPNVAVLMRGITLFYAALSIALTYLLARQMGHSRRVGVLAAALLAVAPLHAVSSHFGTADITVVFYFYLSLMAGAAYLRTGLQRDFIVFAALCGAAVAIKFFVTLGVALALVVLIDPYRDWKKQVLLSLLVAYVTFAAFSFFNFNPWAMHRLISMLRYDNLSVGAGGLSPVQQLKQYALDGLPGLGLALAALVALGIISAGVRQVGNYRRRQQIVPSAPGNAWQRALPFLRSQQGLILVVLAVHAALILKAQTHDARHLLVFIPVLCVFAAAALLQFTASLRFPAAITAIVIAGILAYQFVQVRAIDSLFGSDVRAQLADWVSARSSEGLGVDTTSEYSWVRGSELVAGHDEVLANASYYITCDIEFSRYFGEIDSARILHTAGQERADFFRALFSERLPLHLVREFKQPPRSLEQRLFVEGRLNSVGTYVPQLCYAFARDGDKAGVSSPSFPELRLGSW